LRRLNVPRDPSRLPLVEIQFNLERVGKGFKLPELIAEGDSCPKRFVNFDLFLNVVESDAGLVLDCDYNSDLFDHSTIKRWLGHYITLLQGMIDQSNIRASALSILDARERSRIVADWHASRRVCHLRRARLRHLHISFDRQAPAPLQPVPLRRSSRPRHFGAR
jgi:non-ribosomal peptide synthetase component F